MPNQLPTPESATVVEATFVWDALASTPERPALTVRGKGPDGLPVLLSEQQKGALLDAFLAQVHPEGQAAAEGFMMVSDLLAYVADRVEVDGQILAHPDGSPVVSSGWLETVKRMRGQ